MAISETVSLPGEKQGIPAKKEWKDRFQSEPFSLAWLALAWLCLLTFICLQTAGQYGFHRDELNFIENARHLDWGYVEYPPLTPWIGWLVLRLFGPSLVAMRFTAALAICISIWLTGMMTRALGGTRLAQAVAALATATAPIVLFDARFFSYQTFDYFWWVLSAYLMVQLLKTRNPRWWVAIGVVAGLGVMTKYTLPFLLAGMIVGMLLHPIRRHFTSPWLWVGVGLAVLICLPNLIWQVQHDFISLDFQLSTRAYNISIGRTGSFLLQQFTICTNPAAITLWIGGLYFFLFHPGGKRYRPLGWMYLVPLALFLAARGRFYYLSGAYPVLIAAGASQAIRPRMDAQGRPILFWSRAFWRRLPFSGWIFYACLIGCGLFFLGTMLPVTPVGSPWWQFDAYLNAEIREEIGWPELVQEVARIYTSLPQEEQAQTSILAMNYGEAAAINLYGPSLGLPGAISGVDTFWLRGYGDPPPQRLIVLGMHQQETHQYFLSCQLAGQTPNPYHILNEETRDHPNIFLCWGVRQPWSEFWLAIRRFG